MLVLPSWGALTCGLEGAGALLEHSLWSPIPAGWSHCSPPLECEWKEGELSSPGPGRVGFLEQSVPREASGSPNASWNSPGCEHQGSTWPFLCLSLLLPFFHTFWFLFQSLLLVIIVLSSISGLDIPVLAWICSHRVTGGAALAAQTVPALGEVGA